MGWFIDKTRTEKPLDIELIGGQINYLAQARIFEDMLKQMQTMEKRFGVQANIEGYELDKDDTEGKEIIDAYRKGNDMADLMELAESDNLTLDDSVGGPLLYSVDSHVGMSQSPA